MKSNQESPLIGTLKERSLHASIKKYYALPGDQIEVPLNGFVIDIVRKGLLIEIQTSNFGSLRNKLNKLNKKNPIEIVFPIAAHKWIVKKDVSGNIISRRKSPKRGKIEDVFGQIIYIPKELLKTNISLKVLMIQLDEIWVDDGKGSWRRKKWSKLDQKLLCVDNEYLFINPADYEKLISPSTPEIFTTTDLSVSNKITKKQAQKMCYALKMMNIIDHIGKKGRSYLYQKSQTSVNQGE